MAESQATSPETVPVPKGTNFLAKELFAIFSEQVGTRQQLLDGLPAHHEYQLELEAEGLTFAAGPLFEGEGPPRAGLIVVRARSFSHAREIADRDPFHQSGVRTYKILRWLVNEGVYTIRVKYSNQTVSVD